MRVGAEVGHVQANAPEKVQRCVHKSERALKALKVRCGFTATRLYLVSLTQPDR